MEWKKRVMGLQIELEKQMMQMVTARLIYHFFGSANDGLGDVLGALPLKFCEICGILWDWKTMESLMLICLHSSCRLLFKRFYIFCNMIV
ncbi:hypothetical protein PVL29_014364 [Vitis rotundifolia]|uniref:Uncharacterized protein n=1 Tax=Vitis rotundifolia TaxID=103349 RepID=A0AA39DM84_VITRO|nr:hypothetical protein PVL29_014364 [Vitis rotundifolia]